MERNLNNVSEIQLDLIVTKVSKNRLKGSFNLASKFSITLTILFTDASFIKPRGL